MNGDQLQTILQGLENNNLLSNIHHLLTGYIGSVTFLRSVLNVLQILKTHNANVRYVCDPVLGDNGKVYVPKELIDVYRNDVIPLANVVTPNQFEVELLTGISIHTIQDAIQACQFLHQKGPDLVLITSIIFNDDNEQKDKVMTILASERVKDEVSGQFNNHVWSIETPIVPGRFTGTGDVTAALILAWTAKINNLKDTLEKIASTMYALIKYTAQGSDGSVMSRELKLIQSKNMIENPTIIFQAQKLV
jgi:pyridoxine kinase